MVYHFWAKALSEWRDKIIGHVVPAFLETIDLYTWATGLFIGLHKAFRHKGCREMHLGEHV